MVLCSLTTVMVGHGGARHIYYLTPSQLSNAVKFNWIAQAFGITIVGTGKVSTAFLMLKIMGPKTVWRKWFLYVSVVLTLIFTILAALFAFVQCDPPRALWEKVPGAKCWDPKINTDWSIFSACQRALWCHQ